MGQMPAVFEEDFYDYVRSLQQGLTDIEVSDLGLKFEYIAKKRGRLAS